MFIGVKKDRCVYLCCNFVMITGLKLHSCYQVLTRNEHKKWINSIKIINGG